MMDQSTPAAPAADAASSSGRHPSHRGRRDGKRRTWLAALFLFLALAAGVVIGIGCTILYFQSHNPQAKPRTDDITKSIISRMESMVTLNAEEKSSIETLIRARMAHIGTVREKSREEIRSQFEEMGQEISQVMGPERYKVWDEYVQKRIGEGKEPRRKQNHNQPDRH